MLRPLQNNAEAEEPRRTVEARLVYTGCSFHHVHVSRLLSLDVWVDAIGFNQCQEVFL